MLVNDLNSLILKSVIPGYRQHPFIVGRLVVCLMNSFEGLGTIIGKGLNVKIQLVKKRAEIFLF